MQEFFRFPSPVDAIESRLHAAMTILVAIPAALLSVLPGFPWLWLYLTYGFLARCLCGPRLDPQVRRLLGDARLFSAAFSLWKHCCAFPSNSLRGRTAV